MVRNCCFRLKMSLLSPIHAFAVVPICRLLSVDYINERNVKYAPARVHYVHSTAPLSSHVNLPVAITYLVRLADARNHGQ